MRVTLGGTRLDFIPPSVRAGQQYPLGGCFARPLNPHVRAAGILLAYFLGVLLVATLVAPWFFQLGQWFAGEVTWLKGLAQQPFHRYLNRCLLVVALAGLWPLARSLQLTSLRAVGLAWTPVSRRQLSLGLVVGFGSLLLAALGLVLVGVRSANFNLPLATVVKLLLNATLSAVVVALVEELFFRGVIFGALRQATRLPVALGLSSALYAALHFLARVEFVGPVDWASGLTLLPQMMRGVMAPENLLPALTLTVGGAVLALAYHRTGSLWFSVGLHAGWVFWLKVFKTVTVTSPTAGGAFWGTDKLVDGWLTLFVMGALLVGVARSRLLGQSPAVAHERPLGPNP